jgi:hypothetical protein
MNLSNSVSPLGAIEMGADIVQYWSVLVSIAAGGVGYLFVTFYMRPVLRYRSIKYQIISDLFFYQDVINADGLNDVMKERMNKRIQSNRRNASDLAACCPVFPFWYKGYLKLRGEHVEQAAAELIGLSNTFDHVKAADSVARIKRYLKIKTGRI